MPPTAAPGPRSTKKKTSSGDVEPLSNSSYLERLREFQLKMIKGGVGGSGGCLLSICLMYQHPQKFCFSINRMLYFAFLKIYVQIMTKISNSQGENEQRFRKAHGISSEDAKGTCRVCLVAIFFDIDLPISWLFFKFYGVSAGFNGYPIFTCSLTFFKPDLIKFIGYQVTRNIG